VSAKKASLVSGVPDDLATVARAVRRALRPRASVLTVGALGALGSMASGGIWAADGPAASADAATSDRSSVEEVVVTGRRKAIESADELKRTSESIIDTVNADDAGKLPDVSLTEVLQRIPGVTITRWGDPDHFQAQGTGVQVRGLSNVAGRINGREVFSANGGNGLSWSDIPPELMAGVDVYKTSTANLIEGGSGGQIDLRTKMPFDYKGFTAQGTANADRADFRKKTSPSYSLLLADTFDIGGGRIGLLADVAYGKYASRSDFFAVEPYYKTRVGTDDRYIPGGFDYGTSEYDRTRKGAYAAVQWQPTENLEIDQTYFESKYEQANLGQGVFMVTKLLSVHPGGNTVFDSHGGLISSDSLYQYDPTNLTAPGGTFSAGGDTGIGSQSSDTRDLSTSFRLGSDSGRWKLRGAFQSVDSKSHQFSYDVFPTIPFATNNFGMNLGAQVPVVTMPASTQAALQDPAQYTYQATMDHLADNVAKLRAENLDFDFNLSDSGFFRSFQVGARYADHSEVDQTSGYNWQALGVGWNGSPPVSFAAGNPGDYSAKVFDNFFQGKTVLPGNVLLPSLAMAARADVIGDHQRYGNPVTHGIEYQPGERANVKYTDASVYGLVRFADDTGILGIPYRGNFGARVVRTEHKSDGFYLQKSSGGPFIDSATGIVYTLAGPPDTVPVPLSGSRTNTEVLPSLNLELVPNPILLTRFSYTETMDLPSVQDIQANGTLGVTTVSTGAPGGATNLGSWNVTFGNPNLAPVLSHNFDLSQEWYPKPGTALHAAAFYKSIDNWLVYNSIARPWPVVLTSGNTNINSTITVNYSGVANSPQKAKVQGVEVGVHTYFDMLPGALKGLGVDLNGTLIDSKNPGDVYYDISGLPHNDAPLVGLSKRNYNAALLYDYKIWSARLAYNWRSEYLLSTNANGSNGNYVYYSANTPATTNCQSPAATTCKYIKIALPVYAGAYGQLDFGLTLRPSEHWYVEFQVANLTNAVVKSFFGGYPGGQYTRNYFVSDRHFNLSAGFKF
jgi:TonB-dependent receptor